MPEIIHDPTRTHFSQIYRRSLMFFLIFLFFLISPLIILYTAGIRFNFPRFVFEPTGALSIDVKPHDANLLVNDVLVFDGLPARISGLASGIYRIRVEKDGFHSYTKDLSVIPGETTYVRDISLFQKADPVKIQEMEDGTVDIFILAGEPLRYAYLSKISSAQFLTIIGTDYKEIPLSPNSDTTCDRKSKICTNTEKTERTKFINWETGAITEPNTSAENPGEADEAIVLEKNFSLVRDENSIMVTKNKDAGNEETKKIPARSWYYHEPTNEWRIASEWEITTVYSDGNSAIIYRSDKPIQSIRSLDEFNSILIATDHLLIAVNPGYATSQELAYFDSITAIDSDITAKIIMVAGVWRGERGLFMLKY